MRGVRVGSSCSLSLCSDTVVSMSQQAGAAGSGGAAAGRVAVQGFGGGAGAFPAEARGSWSSARGPGSCTAPAHQLPLSLRRGPGSPEDPNTQTQQRPDTACFIARLSQPLTELEQNAQIINNLTYNK